MRRTFRFFYLFIYRAESTSENVRLAIDRSFEPRFHGSKRRDTTTIIKHVQSTTTTRHQPGTGTPHTRVPDGACDDYLSRTTTALYCCDRTPHGTDSTAVVTSVIRSNYRTPAYVERAGRPRKIRALRYTPRLGVHRRRPAAGRPSHGVPTSRRRSCVPYRITGRRRRCGRALANTVATR